MSEDNRHTIDRLVDNGVDYLSAHGADCIVIGLDKNGRYAMRSNLGKSHAWVLLDQARARLKDQIEAQRSGENQNEGTGKE